MTTRKTQSTLLEFCIDKNIPNRLKPFGMYLPMVARQLSSAVQCVQALAGAGIEKQEPAMGP